MSRVGEFFAVFFPRQAHVKTSMAFHRCCVFLNDLLNRTKKNRGLNCVGVNAVLIFPIHDLNIRHKKIRSWQPFQDVTAPLSVVTPSRMEDHTNNVTKLSGVADQTTVCLLKINSVGDDRLFCIFKNKKSCVFSPWRKRSDTRFVIHHRLLFPLANREIRIVYKKLALRLTKNLKKTLYYFESNFTTPKQCPKQKWANTTLVSFLMNLNKFVRTSLYFFIECLKVLILELKRHFWYK